MGLWATDPTGHPRESVTGQQDEHGQVQTDTLVLVKPARVAQVRLTLTGDGADARPSVSFIGLSLLDPRVKLDALPPNREAWGRELEVPERTQVVYPEGVSAWCSPTTLSMLLAYWAKIRSRPDLELGPAGRAVNDQKWPAPASPFNTAFAELPRMRAQRPDVSGWGLDRAGVPVAASSPTTSCAGSRGIGRMDIWSWCAGSRRRRWSSTAQTGKDIRRVFSRQNLVRPGVPNSNPRYPLAMTPPGDRLVTARVAPGPKGNRSNHQPRS
jgi:hypothetical protein